MPRTVPVPHDVSRGVRHFPAIGAVRECPTDVAAQSRPESSTSGTPPTCSRSSKSGEGSASRTPRGRRVLGWTPEDLADRPFIEFVHPDDVGATMAESIAEWDETSHTRSGFENRLRCRDGSYRWIEWTSQRRGDLIYATGRDVTARNAEYRRTGGERRDDQGDLRRRGRPHRHHRPRSGDRPEQPAGTEFLRLRRRRGEGGERLSADAPGRPPRRGTRPAGDVRREPRRDRELSATAPNTPTATGWWSRRGATRCASTTGR